MKKFSSVRFVNRTLNEGQFSWAIRFLFVISIILIIILSFSYNSINKDLIFYSEKVDYTHEVLDKVNELKVSLHEVTYHVRGYLILGDSANRLEMQNKVDKLIPMAYQLDTLLADSDTRLLSRSLLFELENYRESTHAIAISNFAQISKDQRDTLLLERSAHIGTIKKLLTKLSEVENKLMLNRVQSRNNYKQQVFRFNWVIMGVALAFLISAFILLERELNQNKKFKIELENKVVDLNRSNNELEQFAYVASHDLKEPLRKIRSFTDLLLAKYLNNLTEEGGMMLNKIDKSATRMQLLIDDLLAFSRSIDNAHEPEEVDLNEILLEVKNNLSESIRSTSAEIIYAYLPTITGYSSQMVQLFQNLISNSIKYSKPNLAPKIKITWTVVEGSDIPNALVSHENLSFYRITVQDNGIGFKKEYAEKIFVIFKRLHNQEMFQGSGIGLAICRKVISNHNGYISAEGQEGFGAKFYLYLPKQTNGV